MAAMIELRGAHFRNKGAQLMLIAMVEGLRRIRPDADLVIAPTHRSPYLDRASLGLYQKVWLQKAGIQWGPLISACLPQLFKDAYGLVDDRRVTTVLDASGFAYSDQWGGTHTVELASAAARWVRQGTRLILMPQAFGPFQLRRNRSAMQRVAGMATAIFARDDVSLAHLQSILPAADTDKVRLAPDFTALVASRPCSDWPVPAGGACLIPNKRLIDKRGIGPDQYAALFRSVARMARQADLSPFFLVHEGPEDAALVEAINRSLDSPVPVLAPSDSRVIKGIIGKAELVFGSRFHGLVSAVSQHVPAVAVGWSHKYQQLFADYQVPEFAFDMADSPPERILDGLAFLLDAGRRAELRKGLRASAALQEQRIDAMWGQLDALI